MSDYTSKIIKKWDSNRNPVVLYPKCSVLFPSLGALKGNFARKQTYNTMKHSMTKFIQRLLLICLIALPAYGEAAARNVSGKITDSGNQPIPGAAVMNKANGLGSISDLDGRFSIEVFSMSSGSVDNTAMLVCSYIPFTSPMAMFTRICMSTVAWYEIAISIAILVGSTVGIGVLSAKIYRVGVLLYGMPPKFSTIMKTVFKKQ